MCEAMSESSALNQGSTNLRDSLRLLSNGEEEVLPDGAAAAAALPKYLLLNCGSRYWFLRCRRAVRLVPIPSTRG